MSLSCQIKVYSPPEGAFRPTQEVSGIIKFTAYEDIFLRRIIVSLKGVGCLDLEGKAKRRFKETYVDIDSNVQENFKGFTLSVGTYEEQFTFELPNGIPPSTEYKTETSRHKVDLCISYYIRIKFDRGYWKADKSFKKNISVKPTIIPRLPNEPINYDKMKILRGERVLRGMTTSYSGIVKMVAAIEKSFVYVGDTIIIHYKLKNSTNAVLNGITAKLVEKVTFKPNRPFIKSSIKAQIGDIIPCSDGIAFGSTATNTIEIEVPRDVFSIEHSTLVIKEYLVKIKVELPPGHGTFAISIPVQIGDKEPLNAGNLGESTAVVFRGAYFDRPPPSYWETMGEEAPAEETEEVSVEEREDSPEEVGEET